MRHPVQCMYILLFSLLFQINSLSRRTVQYQIKNLHSGAPLRISGRQDPHIKVPPGSFLLLTGLTYDCTPATNYVFCLVNCEVSSCHISIEINNKYLFDSPINLLPSLDHTNLLPLLFWEKIQSCLLLLEPCSLNYFSYFLILLFIF